MNMDLWQVEHYSETPLVNMQKQGEVASQYRMIFRVLVIRQHLQHAAYNGRMPMVEKPA